MLKKILETILWLIVSVLVVTGFIATALIVACKISGF